MFSKYQDKKSLRSLQKNPNWKLLKFSDVLRDETKNAKKIKKEEYLAQGSYPIIDQGKDYIAGFTNDGDGIYDKSPLIIFGDHTRILKYIDFPIFIGADGVKLLKNVFSEEEVLTKYIYYYLRTVNIPDTGYNRHFKFLKEVVIPIPSIDLQKRIVSVLDKAQELIDKRKAQIEALDQLTQSVFLEMFGDPATNPKKWPMGFIKDLALKTQYGTSKKASEDTGKYPILRMNNITYEGHWDLTDLKYVDLDDKEVEKYLVHKGELLFNRTNSKELVGKTAVYRFEKPMAFAGYLVKLIPNEKANAEFISAYLNSKYGKSILFSMAKNIVGMANINAEELKSIKIYIPPKQLQDQFAEIVQKIESQRELFKKGLVELEKNFNSLMQRAFKGELFND
ncbi:restriction endonuclease subunit S [Geobacillus sp. G4]|uniref:restriction endonuclease subunit S n=1 Tax=Geobacillus sp. G4 TaxID=3169691 RepID=UPI00333C6E50